MLLHKLPVFATSTELTLGRSGITCDENETNHIKSTLLAGCLIAASVLLMLPAETADAVSVTSVSFGDPPDGQNDTYKKGDAISIEVVFSEAVTVTGAPSLDFRIYFDPGGQNDWTAAEASYSTGTGTNTLTFTFTVPGNREGIRLLLVRHDALQLNGGSIRAGADAINTLGTGSVESTSDVDGKLPLAGEPEWGSTAIAAGASGARSTIFTVEFPFDEVVFGFEEADILLENTPAQVVQGSLAVDATDPKSIQLKSEHLRRVWCM